MCKAHKQGITCNAQKRELHVEPCDYHVDNQKVIWPSLDDRHGWHGDIGFDHERIQFILAGLGVEGACIGGDVVLMLRIICVILAKIKKIFWTVFIKQWFQRFFDQRVFSWLEARLYGT